MRTEDWIAVLATRAGPAPRHQVAWRLAAAAALGLLASGVATWSTLGLNPALAATPAATAIKFAYLGALAFGGVALLDRLARPGASPRRASVLLAAIVLAMAALAAVALLGSAPAQRPDLLWGRSWSSCPWRIAALSAPALLAALWALRGLAPTRPRLAGLGAGLFAGVLGALGYALYCSETSPLFVLAWYSLGITLVAAAGAALGARWLRW